MERKSAGPITRKFIGVQEQLELSYVKYILSITRKSNIQDDCKTAFQ